MNRLSIVVACSLFLAACGGGGSSDTPPGPKKYIPVAQKAGDAYFYTRTDTLDDGTSQTYTYSTQVATVSGSGSRYVNTYNQNNVSIDASLYNANNNLISDASGCTYTPAVFTINTPLFVGQSYSQNAEETCNLSSGRRLVDIQTSVNVESYETITVTAGTFNTLRIKTRETFASPFLTSSFNPSVKVSTCWVDIVTGVNVKCSSTITFLDPVTPTTVTSYTFERTRSATAATDAFILTGSLGNVTIPFLYLTPGRADEFFASGNVRYQFNTTEPVTWLISVGDNTGATAISTVEQSVIGSGLTVTASATSTSFNASTNGSTLSSPVEWIVQATLVSDPTKYVQMYITNRP